MNQHSDKVRLADHGVESSGIYHLTYRIKGKPDVSAFAEYVALMKIGPGMWFVVFASCGYIMSENGKYQVSWVNRIESMTKVCPIDNLMVDIGKLQHAVDVFDNTNGDGLDEGDLYSLVHHDDKSIVPNAEHDRILSLVGNDGLLVTRKTVFDVTDANGRLVASIFADDRYIQFHDEFTLMGQVICSLSALIDSGYDHNLS